MKKKPIFLLSLIIIIIVSCKEKNKEFFSGTLVEFELPVNIDTIRGTPILLDGIYTGYMSVYDSLISFYSPKYTEKYLNIFSLNTGKHLASICNKGEGPDDFTRFTHRSQYMIEDNEIKLWSYDNHKKSVLINLTKSINNQTTKIDSIIPIDWLKKFNIYWSEFFALDDKRFIIKNQSENIYLQGKSWECDTYHLYQNTFDNKIASYKLYKNIFEDEKDIYRSDLIFYTLDNICPTNKDKIAMGMLVVPQINILDINTGELTGYRMKGFHSEELLNFQFHIYYKHISVTEDYIYALLIDKEVDKEGKNFLACGNEVHIFDWAGSLIRRIFLNEEVQQIAFNPVDKKLYGINNEDEVFSFSIN